MPRRRPYLPKAFYTSSNWQQSASYVTFCGCPRNNFIGPKCGNGVMENTGKQGTQLVFCAELYGSRVGRHLVSKKGFALIRIAEVHLEMMPGAVLQHSHVP